MDLIKEGLFSFEKKLPKVTRLEIIPTGGVIKRRWRRALGYDQLINWNASQVKFSYDEEREELHLVFTARGKRTVSSDWATFAQETLEARAEAKKRLDFDLVLPKGTTLKVTKNGRRLFTKKLSEAHETLLCCQDAGRTLKIFPVLA